MDLHAVSAFEAITTLLKVSELKKLSRLTHWEIISPQALEQEALNDINRICNETYYIVNPNKESWTINSIPSAGSSLSRLLVEVKTKNTPIEVAVINKIKIKLNIDIQSIKKSTIWDLRFDKESTLSKEDIERRIINTSATDLGILVHPLYEEFSYLKA